MEGSRNLTRCETLRRGSTEILRVSISVDGLGELPDKLRLFYGEMGERALNGALRSLGARAEDAYNAAVADGSAGRGFFKRLRYSYECRSIEKREDRVTVETSVKLLRGGAELFGRKIIHIWALPSLTLLPVKTTKNAACDNREKPCKIRSSEDKKIVKN